MRIIAGIKKGYKIAAPKTGSTRPTSDMVRGSIFNLLEYGALSLDFSGLNVLDLFAGTGALGLEALSRGALRAYFVEQNKIALKIIYQNIEHLEFEESARVLRADVLKLAKFRDKAKFDVVFIDPPYGMEIGVKACQRLSDHNLLNDNAVIIIEDDARAEISLASPFKLLDKRIYGNTAIHIYQYEANANFLPNQQGDQKPL